MSHQPRGFFIDGEWIAASGREAIATFDPASEEKFADLAIGTAADVDAAVAAARQAFAAFSTWTVAERIALLERVVSAYDDAAPELAYLMHREMGAPLDFAVAAHVGAGRAHLTTAIDVLRTFAFEEQRGGYVLRHEPIGVCGMITPWNWPMNQLLVKVAPALAAGCTMVVKPSEFSSSSASRLAEVMQAARVPPGVFNLVTGDGPHTGDALARHPDVDMISITGSVAAGVSVARAAAESIKRVHQELGGKSAFVMLADADARGAIEACVTGCFLNSGQNCAAPTRLLVPAARLAEVERLATEVAATFNAPLGPVVNRRQFDNIQRLIGAGLSEGAHLICGGPGRPDGVARGYFVRPTIFSRVTSRMAIAREEIFGPVLSILSYTDDEDAVRIANDSPFGLAAYVHSPDPARGKRVAERLRAGTVYINHASWNPTIPVGGYRQSGNGREHGEFGLRDFLELKAIAV